MAECILATESAPTAVDDLPQLLDTYLESGGLARDMVTTGNDYWGNRIQIEAVVDEPGRYALRSLGPNGVLDQQEPRDDIVITYRVTLNDTLDFAR
ncbi:MAG: hypothetical protein R3C18_07530 [Planctomycetaceae bacterium]